ncbi:hypothetical protein DFJ74DRAFT_715314, partial [Hyaloraphidium curvatum]
AARRGARGAARRPAARGFPAACDLALLGKRASELPLPEPDGVRARLPPEAVCVQPATDGPGIRHSRQRHPHDARPADQGADGRRAVVRAAGAGAAACPGGDDLEAAQSLILLVNVFLGANAPVRTYPLMHAAARSADALFRALPEEDPPDATAWIKREMVLRLRIPVSAVDVINARFSGKPAFCSYFHRHRYPLPVAEAFFGARDPEAVFSALKSARGAGNPWASVEFGGTTWPAITSTVRALVAAAFNGAGSPMLVYFAAHYLRHHLNRLAREPATPERREQLAQLATASDVLPSVLPPFLAASFSRGDPSALLSSPALPFSSPAHAVSALRYALTLEDVGIHALAAAGFSSACAARAHRFALLLRGLLRADPGFMHMAVMVPAYTAGRALLASVRIAPQRGLPARADSSTGSGLAWAQVSFARSWGLMARGVADSYAGEAREAGVDLAGAAPRGEEGTLDGRLEVPDEGQAPEGRVFLSLGDVPAAVEAVAVRRVDLARTIAAGTAAGKIAAR